MSTATHPPADQPLIPMPALTLPAIKQAVATLVPSRLPELFEDMQQAFTWAGERSSVAPIHVFYVKWGTVVAIERIPARAARFHELERVSSTAGTAKEAREASASLGAILAEAQQEIGA